MRYEVQLGRIAIEASTPQEAANLAAKAYAKHCPIEVTNSDTGESERFRMQAWEHTAAKPVDEDFYACWFTPDAIRDHFDSDVVDNLAPDQLWQIAEYCISADSLWDLFHELLVDAMSDIGIDDPYENSPLGTRGREANR